LSVDSPRAKVTLLILRQGGRPLGEREKRSGERGHSPHEHLLDPNHLMDHS
jgi:hypothetical protein